MVKKLVGLSLILLCSAGYASEDELHLSDDTIPLVITPSRLKQSLADVPASVTIITRETIRALGIRSIPEALRLVPGMTIGQAAGNDYRIEYHGTNGQLPQRMAVQLDGMSVYGTEAARVYWDRLPVAIDDVERIEVTRGPNSAAYGSNALLAVVNIVTTHPQDSLGLTVSTLNGSLSTRDFMARYGHSIGDTSFRFTLDHQEDEGFDFNETRIDERHDGTEITRFNARSVTQYDNSHLDFHVGFADTTWEDEFEEENEISNPDANWKDHFISSTWSKSLSSQHSIQLRGYGIGWERKQYWNTCYPTLLITPELRALSVANEEYVLTVLGGEIPTGGTPEEDAMVADVFDRIAALGGLAGALAPTCARVNQNFDRAQYDIEFQDTYVFSEKLRSVVGIGFRHDEVKSETYFADKNPSRFSSRAFFNIEYRPSHWWTFNVGGMLEDEDDVLDSTEFSPKLGANFHFNKNHTVKFVYSEALRTPDFLATERDWNYVFRDLDPPLDGMNEAVFFLRRDAVSAGDNTLRPERIVAQEIIYQLLMTEVGVSAEIKAFRNSIDDAMTEDFGFFVINYSNDYSFDLEGYEAQINYQPTHNLITTLTFASMDNSADIFTENSLYAAKSGSLSFRYALNTNWRLALAHYVHNAGTSDFFDYRRSDLVIGYETSVDNSDIEATFIIRSQPKDQSAFARQETSVIHQFYKASSQYYLGLKFKL